MAHRILIIDGHPDATESHFVHELAQYYVRGAEEGGHKTQVLRVGALKFPLLTSNVQYLTGKVPAAIRAAQKSIRWANHIVIVYPLWLGTMPAVLKGFIEQVFRPGFAFPKRARKRGARRPLTGRSAHIVVTTGMPGVFHGQLRIAHRLRSVEREVLEFCGIGPVRTTVIGSVEDLDAVQRDHAYYTMRRLGASAR